MTTTGTVGQLSHLREGFYPWVGGSGAAPDRGDSESLKEEVEHDRLRREGLG